MTVHSALRHGALGASTVAALTALLLASGCSAPPGTDTGDDVPEFAGTLSLPGSGNPGTGSPGVGVPGASNGAGTASGNTNTSAPASGAGGSANTSAGEQTGSGIGLQPAASNANTGQNPGAGGSTMAGTEPSSGAAGSSFEPGATGNAGSTSMPPSANPPAPPAQNPPPTPPAQNPPPISPPPPLNADCTAAFFCDGFENVADGASPSASLWSIIDGYSVRPQSANVLVSADNARSGARALRVSGTDSRTGVRATLPQTRYFVRAWLQIDSASPGPVFIGLGTDQNSEARLRIQGNSFATINSVGPGDKVHPDANSGNCPECITLVPNEWFCAEFFMDDATQNATLWIDGVEAASKVNGDGGWPVQPDNPFFFLGSMSVQGAISGVWIDDVAAGPARLGCD
jgi:hypothetical protein